MKFGLKTSIPVLSICILLSVAGCKKEKVYIFDVDDVSVTQAGAAKPNIKTDEEFISIAYSDLFGTTISQSDLEDLALAYVSFGDKRAIIDWIILNFLNDTNADIPTDPEMRADVEKFVEESFQKFLVREPNEFEKWWIANKIEGDASITPELAYYAFMTSNEYRFY